MREKINLADSCGNKVTCLEITALKCGDMCELAGAGLIAFVAQIVLVMAILFVQEYECGP